MRDTWTGCLASWCMLFTNGIVLVVGSMYELNEQLDTKKKMFEEKRLPINITDTEYLLCNFK